MGLVWKRNSDQPKILYHSRFPEYRVDDMVDNALTDLAIARGALTTAGIQFNSSLRDVLHGFDPFLGLGTDRSADDSFQRLTYGGYLMRQGLSQSVPTRIVANRPMERQLLFDPFHPDAFKNTSKFHTALLDENDFALNRAAFSENGYSKGMFYNTYCNARVTLADGRVYVFGGHDMQSDNGCTRSTSSIRRPSCGPAAASRAPGRTGHAIGSAKACSRAIRTHPSSKTATRGTSRARSPRIRQIRSHALVPVGGSTSNGWVLVLGGFDQDGTVPPDPLRVEKGRNNQSQSDAAFTASRVNIVVPEVYDPVTDRNIALENARMAFPLYPQMEIVQTGPGQDDWKVCTYDGEINYGGIESELTPASAYRNAQGERQLGGARFGVGGGTPLH